MAPEFIALKMNKARREDGSWLDCLIKYYTKLNVSPMNWVAPEFFCFEYTQNSEKVSLGAILFAILERDSIQIRNEKVYGVFKCILTGGKVGLGYAMATYDPEISAKFSRQAQGSRALQKIALDALQYDKNDRPTAAEIHDRVISARQAKAQVSHALQRIALDASQYNKNDRPTAAEIHDPDTSVRQGRRRHTPGTQDRQQPLSEFTCGCCFPLIAAWSSRSEVTPEKEIHEMHFKVGRSTIPFQRF